MLKSGIGEYWSRSRKSLWLQGMSFKWGAKPKVVMSDEAKEKMRAAKKGLQLPQTRVAVIATDKYGNDVVYDGIVSAAKAIHPENLKAAQKNIQQAAKGRRRVAYGYTWKYAS